MRHFLALVIGVALLDFSSAAQPPHNDRGRGRPLGSPAAASPAAAIPAAAIFNPSRALHELLTRVANAVMGGRNKRAPPPEPVSPADSQGFTNAPAQGTGVTPFELSSSPSSDGLSSGAASPEDQGSRSELEKLLAQAASARESVNKSSGRRGSAHRRRRQRRRASQSVVSTHSSSSIMSSAFDDSETPLTLDDVFNQISQVSLFSAKTESKLPVWPRKDKKRNPKADTKKKNRWNALKRNPDSDSEDDDAPFLAVLPRKPPARGSPLSKAALQGDSSKESSAEPETPTTPQAALQQLLSDTADSMGFAAWTPITDSPPSKSDEAPSPSPQLLSPLSTKDSRDTLEDLLQQASANIAAAAKRKKAPRGNLLLGKKNAQRHKGERPDGEEDEPILAVLPRRASNTHLSAVQAGSEPASSDHLSPTDNAQDSLQQLMDSSPGPSSWGEAKKHVEGEPEISMRGSVEEGNAAQVIDGAPTGVGPLLQQSNQGSDEAPKTQPVDPLEAGGPQAADTNAEAAKVGSLENPRTAALAATVWDLKESIFATRKAAEAAKAARVAATTAKGISALPGPPNAHKSSFEFGRTRGHMKWEDEESVSEETTESDETLSSEAGSPAVGWDSARTAEAAERLKGGFSHSQWRMENRQMGGLPRNTQPESPESSEFFPSQSSHMLGGGERTPSMTPSSSELYEDDSDFAKDGSWGEPPAFGALSKGSEESAGAPGAREAPGAPAQGQGGTTQPAQQGTPAAATGIQRRVQDPPVEGSEELGSSSAQKKAAAANEGKRQKRGGAPAPKTENPTPPKGNPTGKGNSSAGNSETQSGGWGPAIVFGLMLLVGLCVTLGIWLHSRRKRKAKKDAAKAEVSIPTENSMWATSIDLSSRGGA